jgi:DNA ligase 1
MRTFRKSCAALLGMAVALVSIIPVWAQEPATAAAAQKSSPALLLANVWNPSIDPTGWWMSEKFDGLRGYWDGEKL